MFWFFGPEACGILAPWPGIEPAPPALEGEVLTTGPPGKSQDTSFLQKFDRKKKKKKKFDRQQNAEFKIFVQNRIKSNMTTLNCVMVPNMDLMPEGGQLNKSKDHRQAGETCNYAWFYAVEFPLFFFFFLAVPRVLWDLFFI